MKALPQKTILVADDEPNLRRVLAGILRRHGHQVVVASDGQQALGAFDQADINTLITDLRMPRLDGMQLLRQVTTDYPDVPVIILTAFGTVDNAVAAVKLGAFDYLEKPFDQDQIKQVVGKALRTNEMRRRQVRLAGDEAAAGGRFGLVGRSAAMQAVYNVIDKVASTPSSVLITGESGTGKELVAQAIHANSPRAAYPLIKVSCAAVPDNLIESELFGHEQGAFAGAVGSKLGRFELADKGTVLLDEIGKIPREMQVKLLRALQEGAFERVGGAHTVDVDVRVMAATHADLGNAVKSGAFREDLYYRLNVVPIDLPPLRERREDIPDLVCHILEKFCRRLGKNAITLSERAQQALMSYDWPGNIRELENVLEWTTLFCSGTVVQPGDLPETFRNAHPEQAPPQTPSPTNLKQIVRAETERVERNAIMAALEETAGNVTHAAKRLAISRKSLQTKMKELGLRNRDPAPKPRNR